MHIYVATYVNKLCTYVLKNIYDMHHLLISAETFSLGGPAPNLLIAVTLTVTLLTKYPMGTAGAVNIKYVDRPVTFSKYSL